MRAILVLATIILIMLSSAALLGPSTPAPPLPPRLAGDGSWLRQAQQLSRLRLPLGIAGLALTPAALWLFVNRGWSARLRRRLVERGIRNQWLLVTVFTCALSAGLALIALPLDAAGFALRRAFGLSSEDPLAWLMRQGLEAAVSLVPSLIAVQGLYWLLRRFPRGWWLGASAGFVLLSVSLVYLEPLIVTPLFFRQQPLADPVLRARILQMGARIGVPVDEVYVIDASKQGAEGNAYFTGVGGSTRIVLYDTLVRSYPPDELLSVLGHEMGHWRERHVWKGLALNAIAAPFGFLAAHVLLRATLPRWGIRSPADIAGLPLLMLLLSLATIATLPIQNWQSRRWEAAADAIAVRATGDREAVARTFAHLARQNLSDPTPPPLIEALFASHPAIGRRVASALAESPGP